MKPGLSTLILKKIPFALDILDAFKKTGIESVELSDLHPGFSYDDKKMFKDLRNKLSSLNMHLNSIHIHLDKFDPEFNLSAVNDTQRKKLYRLTESPLMSWKY